VKNRFNSFSELSRHKTEGVDYKITVSENSRSGVVIVAPHGGGIEWNTSKIAKGVAANDHNLYLFEGIGLDSSFSEMHVTSAAFDEPRCLELVSKMETTLTIHGCRGDEPVIYLGGNDTALRSSMAEEFNKQGIKAVTKGHAYKGGSPRNICNRNKRGKGVQLEFSRGIRDNPALTGQCIDILRGHLKKIIAS